MCAALLLRVLIRSLAGIVDWFSINWAHSAWELTQQTETLSLRFALSGKINQLTKENPAGLIFVHRT